VPYRLSERLNQGRNIETHSADEVDLGKVASLFIIFGILGLVTAWVFSWESKEIFNGAVRPAFSAEDAVQEDDNAEPIGPLTVQKYKEVYTISITSSVPDGAWTFVEGEVLDANKEYLFSFGKELWQESGYDDEGAWREAENHYKMNITFPQPGQYYVKLKAQGNYAPDSVHVKISKRLGSSIPHMVFGIVCLLIGVVINEIRNGTISKLIARMASER
jgi:hypothetical protein